MQSFYLKKLNDAEVEEEHLVEISNRFAALENLDGNVDIGTAWDTSLLVEKAKTWFDKECAQ
jgi:hypothetical protein